MRYNSLLNSAGFHAFPSPISQPFLHFLLSFSIVGQKLESSTAKPKTSKASKSLLSAHNTSISPSSVDALRLNRFLRISLYTSNAESTSPVSQ
ncbi:hypothetical protein IC582_025213 [Cucumis melo]